MAGVTGRTRSPTYARLRIILIACTATWSPPDVQSQSSPSSPDPNLNLDNITIDYPDPTIFPQVSVEHPISARDNTSWVLLAEADGNHLINTCESAAGIFSALAICPVDATGPDDAGCNGTYYNGTELSVTGSVSNLNVIIGPFLVVHSAL